MKRFKSHFIYGEAAALCLFVLTDVLAVAGCCYVFGLTDVLAVAGCCYVLGLTDVLAMWLVVCVAAVSVAVWLGRFGLASFPSTVDVSTCALHLAGTSSRGSAVKRARLASVNSCRPKA